MISVEPGYIYYPLVEPGYIVSAEEVFQRHKNIPLGYFKRL